jgi:hypothetical protein
MKLSDSLASLVKVTVATIPSQRRGSRVGAVVSSNKRNW